MPAIQYLNLDFDGIKKSIKDYLRANSNFTDYDFEGSNLSILIDILAYNTFLNSYNTNMVANESFMNTATIRDNVIAHADNIGYLPRSSRSAKSKISFSLTFDNSNTASSLTLEKGQVAVSNIENANYTFSVLEDITVPINNLKAAFSEIDIYEGLVINQSFTVNTSQRDQKFILDNQRIDTSTIRVRVKKSASEEIYTNYRSVENIIGSDSISNIFLVKEYKDETYQLIFGDGVIGKKLEDGNIIEVTYIVCSEDGPNGQQNFVINGNLITNEGTRIASSGILPIVNQPSIGGSKLESIDSIKKYASRYLATQNRAVTSADYETLIPKIFPKAESAVAYGGETLTPPQYGKVFVSVKPDSSSFLSLFDKNYLKTELKKYSPIGLDIVIDDLENLYIELDVNAYYSTNLTSNPDIVKSKIFTILESYAQTNDITRFGGRFKYSQITALIDNTDTSITSNITNVILRRDLQPIFNSYVSYELCFGNNIFAPENSFYNIKSTGFKIDKYREVVYITDEAVSSSNGKLWIFRMNGDTPEFLQNVGTVDYQSGELFIDSLNITSSVLSSGIIEVECLPASFDILGKRNLFLDIAVESSTINMIRDDVSSGSDTSGVNFSVTPQYNKKGFYRIS